MSKISYPETLARAVANECPRCQDGHVFKSFLKMHEDCPKCGYHFEREPGFFLGAMSFSYIIGFIVVLPLFLYLLFADVPLWVVVGLPTIPIIAMSPLMFHYSRLIYLHLDYRNDPPAK